MSCPGDNWVVPGANPCNNGSGGVQSVGAGTTNVTITGTASNPLVNVSNLGGVTQVEGQTGNVNLNGVGMTIVGASPVAGDITFTATVQNITASGSATVSQPTPGTFNIAVPTASVSNITGTGAANVTQPTAGTYNIAVPIANVTNIVSGGGIGIVNTSGTYQLTPVVQNVTASGSAVVSNPATGTFNINVPVATVQNVTAGAGVTVTNPTTGTFQVASVVQNVTAGTGITVTNPTAGTYQISASSSSGAADNSTFNPVANPVFVSGPAVDGDTPIFQVPLPFTGGGNTLIGNLATANVIIVNLSCGPILGAPTSGATNASYFSIYGKTSGGAGTSVYTKPYGFYVAPYQQTIGGDFQVIFYKSRGEFFGDTTSLQIYITNVPTVPFSNAVQCGIQIPTVSVNITAF